MDHHSFDLQYHFHDTHQLFSTSLANLQEIVKVRLEETPSVEELSRLQSEVVRLQKELADEVLRNEKLKWQIKESVHISNQRIGSKRDVDRSRSPPQIGDRGVKDDLMQLHSFPIMLLRLTVE